MRTDKATNILEGKYNNGKSNKTNFNGREYEAGELNSLYANL